MRFKIKETRKKFGDTRGTASISEKNHAKRFYLKKSRTLPRYE